MKIKQAMRYQLQGFMRSARTFYIVIAAIFIGMLLLNRFVTSGTGSVSGMESATIIFLFVMGLNSFKQDFRLFLQNGISRNTLLVSFAASALSVSVCMAVIDGFFPLLFGNSLHYESFYVSLYGLKGYTTGFSSIAWSALMYLFAMCVGFLITTLYYRMNKPLKVLVSVGVPLLFFVVLPIVEGYYPSIRVYETIGRFINWGLGRERAYVFLPVCSAVLLGFSYLLIRNATIKEG